jgi:excisionase family DNA binding protein
VRARIHADATCRRGVTHAAPFGLGLLLGLSAAAGETMTRKSKPAPLESLPITLTKHDLAKVMRVSTRTVERMIAENRMPVPHVKGAPRLLWSRVEVERWLERRTFDTTKGCAA